MIDYKDLMVGDLVYYSNANKYVTKVLGIRPSSDGDEDNYAIICTRDEKDPLAEQNKKFWQLFTVDILHPIPLTKEILEKNMTSWNDKFETYDFGKLSVSYDDDYDDFDIGNFGVGFLGDQFQYFGSIKYVHELQHALRLLGIDKSIEL